MECLICLDSLVGGSEELSATLCGHIFHHQCVLDWHEKDQSCPKCRKPFFTFQLRQVFLDGNEKCKDCPKLKENVDKLKEDNKKLKEAAQSFETNYLNAKEDLEKLNVELTVLRNSKEKFLKDMTSLTEAGAEAQEKIGRLAPENDSLKEQVEKQKEAMRTLEVNYQCAKEDIDKLNVELQALRSSKEKFLEQITSLTTGREEAEEKIKRLTAEVTSLSNEVATQTKKRQESELHYLDLLRWKEAEPGKSVTKFESPNAKEESEEECTPSSTSTLDESESAEVVVDEKNLENPFATAGPNGNGTDEQKAEDGEKQEKKWVFRRLLPGGSCRSLHRNVKRRTRGRNK